jgi:tRNA(Leu) C34 or U34 (ribose-2'-O)-methylase TrmL
VIPQKKGYPEELLKHVEPAVFSVEHKELTGDNYLESPMPNKLEGFQCFPELVHEKHTLYILTKKGDVKELEANSELQHPPAYGKEIEVPYVPSK